MSSLVSWSGAVAEEAGTNAEEVIPTIGTRAYWYRPNAKHLVCSIRISSVAAVGFAMGTSSSGVEVVVHVDDAENAVAGTKMVAT
jgi:hypothetical protein